MESLFDVYFRKWCSGANQIAFHDCQKNLQNHVFSRIVHLAGTRAPVMESLFDVYFRKWCSRANQIAFHDCQNSLQNYGFSRIIHLASTRAPVIAAH